mgnify:CR=1 FL=1
MSPVYNTLPPHKRSAEGRFWMSKHRGDISVTTPIVYSICVSGTPETDLFDYVRGMTMTANTEAGEPPVTRGYPPSVFARLPQLVERAGNGPSGGGSITAFYTVLAEGDDQQDPIAESARAILDGHIVLSRALADAGHYPAIDIEQSISRAQTQLIDDGHLAQVRQFKQLYSRYQRARDLLAVGAYARGSDPLLDRAIALYPHLESFLQQGIDECSRYDDSLEKLAAVFGAA